MITSKSVPASLRFSSLAFRLLIIRVRHTAGFAYSSEAYNLLFVLPDCHSFQSCFITSHWSADWPPFVTIMQFALPPRKASHPAIYSSRSTRLPLFLRRSRLQLLIFCVLGLGAIIFILSRLTGGLEAAPLGTPPVVIVTVLEPHAYGAQYIENIKENRNEYAKKHGKLFPRLWSSLT